MRIQLSGVSGQLPLINGRELLSHAGKINHQLAFEKSAQEYDKYRMEQKQLQQEESLKELGQDLKQLNPPEKHI